MKSRSVPGDHKFFDDDSAVIARNLFSASRKIFLSLFVNFEMSSLLILDFVYFSQRRHCELHISVLLSFSQEPPGQHTEYEGCWR